MDGADWLGARIAECDTLLAGELSDTARTETGKLRARLLADLASLQQRHAKDCNCNEHRPRLRRNFHS